MPILYQHKWHSHTHTHTHILPMHTNIHDIPTAPSNTQPCTMSYQRTHTLKYLNTHTHTHTHPHWQTYRQTEKQRQTVGCVLHKNKYLNTQTHTCISTHTHTDRHTDRQTYRQWVVFSIKNKVMWSWENVTPQVQNATARAAGQTSLKLIPAQPSRQGEERSDSSYSHRNVAWLHICHSRPL